MQISIYILHWKNSCWERSDKGSLHFQGNASKKLILYICFRMQSYQHGSNLWVEHEVLFQETPHIAKCRHFNFCKFTRMTSKPFFAFIAKSFLEILHLNFRSSLTASHCELVFFCFFFISASSDYALGIALIVLHRWSKLFNENCKKAL